MYLVPFVEDERTVFLKAIIPSRKATKSTSVRSRTMTIDADERQLLESVERGEWKSAGGGKGERPRYSRYAKATFRKDRRLNIRLSSKDLEAIQKRALAEGLPYQTLIRASCTSTRRGVSKRCDETAAESRVESRSNRPRSENRSEMDDLRPVPIGL